MDKFRKALEFDVRLLKRDIRRHIRAEEVIETKLRSLPETSPHQYRWYNQDGHICSSEDARAVEVLHREGWQHLFDWNKHFRR
ncbi:hypothetical protein L6R29_23410 [Myxococcota bacterium]|nr:hypothetical protein [Myxococcota bacterium]